jgi:predicted MPP superfamily phosphohydrolase
MAARILLAVFLLLMLLAPIMIRLLEREGHEAAATWTAFIGFSWMGFLFLSCTCFLVLDFVRLLVRVASRAGFGGNLGSFLPGAGVAFTGVTALVALICIYGWYEASAIRTETVDISSTKIPKAAGTITIAQISDVHLGLLVGEKRLRRILATLREANPDVLVATGDLVDGQMDGSHGLTVLLKGFSPRLGKFAVTGNHELYIGGSQALTFMKEAGFTVLRGDVVHIPGILDIGGVDDPVFIGKEGAATQERTLLAQARSDIYLILLKHRPLVAPESRGKFDLQLSGHVHKGQIFPFELLTRIQFPLPTGFNSIAEGGAVYVSRGTGTWGPPIRFLAPPEVTVFRLRHP